MTTIRPGNYITFLQIGKHTFKDSLKFIKTSTGCNIERIRRKSNKVLPFKKVVKYERNFLTFSYLDPRHLQLGGKLKVHTKEFIFSQLKPHSYYQFGYFTEDKFVFGRFNINNNQELDLDEGPGFSDIIKSSINSTNLVVRHNYELVGNEFQYRLEINSNLIEQYHEDISTPNEDNIIKGELVPKLPLTFTERLFIQAKGK